MPALFAEVRVDSAVFGGTKQQPLWMDIYQPVGDTAGKRPLVILAHGGSFMHGNRRSDRQVAICTQLARHGYVAVSIEYRLTGLPGMSTRVAAYRNIIKAVADGRSSINWFVRDAALRNTWRIDTARIFFGGSSAGAILAEQLGFITCDTIGSKALCKAIHKYLPDSTALPAGRLKGIISLAGAVLDTTIIQQGAPALLHIHGDADRIVPYGYKRAVNGIAPFKMAGLETCRSIYARQQLHFTEYVFKKGGHTPWDRDDAMFAVVMEQLLNFLSSETR